MVIPWRSGCPHREVALAWVAARYAEVHPTWQIVIGVSEGAEWRKADAVAAGLELADGDLAVVTDADVWTDPAAAVAAVELGSPWAAPHRLVHRLSIESTAQVLAGERWEGLPLDGTHRQDSRPYLGVLGGGVVVAERSTLLEVPLDRRFTGWGQEDQAWAIALTRLAGRAWRGDQDLVHLWHPAQDRSTRSIGSREGAALLARYRRARGSADRMRALLAEAQMAEASQ